MQWRQLGQFCLLSAGMCLVSGCAAGGTSGRLNSAPDAYSASKHAVVVEGQQLRGFGGSLLGALRGHVPNMSIAQNGDRCPELAIRGRKSLLGSPNPRIYVDGTRAIDSCVLDQIRAADVERVEVYPNGVTQRPGYSPSPDGLILVFSARHRAG